MKVFELIADVAKDKDKTNVNFVLKKGEGSEAEMHRGRKF